jgi:hypothetical protein
MVEAYASAVTYKVLPIFDNLEAQRNAADEEFDEWFESQEIGPVDGPDFDNLMEAGSYNTVRLELEFDFVPRQMIGLVVAGLFHLWEKLAKEYLFFALEAQEPERLKRLKKADFWGIVAELERFNWQIETEPFFPALNKLRLISNVIKHGAGAASAELMTVAPELFDGNAAMPVDNNVDVDLLLAPDLFNAAVQAVKDFFDALPRQLARNRTSYY